MRDSTGFMPGFLIGVFLTACFAAWDRSLRNIDAMMDERVKLGLPALPTKEHP